MITVPTTTATAVNATSTKTATKKVKVNPSATLIGMRLESPKNSISVNYRQGKTNKVTCNIVEVLDANVTGRRLTVVFKDAQGQEIMKRRIYKEHLERIIDKFEESTQPQVIS
jgi:hypothetical protein